MNRPVDITGQRFGQLVAVRLTSHSTRTGRVIRAWECLCDCGKTTVVRIQTLRNGDSRSCGCLARRLAAERRRIDLSNEVFGRWRVIAPTHRDKRGCIRWECICVCGRKGFLTTGALRAKTTSSCGCLRIERTKLRNKGVPPVGKLPKGEARFHALLDKYRRRALRFNRTWMLEHATARTLFESECYYCGRPPMHRIRGKRANGDFVYNGIDRLDSTKGYEIGNVVTACGDCNKAKLALTEPEFLELVSRIYYNRIVTAVGHGIRT